MPIQFWLIPANRSILVRGSLVHTRRVCPAAHAACPATATLPRHGRSDATVFAVANVGSFPFKQARRTADNSALPRAL